MTQTTVTTAVSLFGMTVPEFIALTLGAIAVLEAAIAIYLSNKADRRHEEKMEAMRKEHGETLKYLASLDQKHAERMEAMRREHEETLKYLASLDQKHAERMEAMRKEHEETLKYIARLDEKHEEKMEAMRKEHEETLNYIARVDEKHNETIKYLANLIVSKTEEVKELVRGG